MKYYPLLLIAYLVGLVLLRVTAEESAWTYTQMVWLNGGALALGVTLLGYVSVNGLKDFPRPARTSGVLTMLIAGVLTYAQHSEIISVFSDSIGRNAPIAAVANGNGTADVPRHWDGHFRTVADVNGRPVNMLVDTGASIVLLTYEDALLAGVDIGALNFNVPILTANGKSHVATVFIEEINIGGVAVSNVDAAVAMQGQLHASLLGMSFLGEIEEAVIRKDRLILRN